MACDSVMSFTESHREVTQVLVAHFAFGERHVPSMPDCNYPTCHKTGLAKVVKESILVQSGSRGINRSHNLCYTACFSKYFYSSSKTKIQQLSSLKTL